MLEQQASQNNACRFNIAGSGVVQKPLVPKTGHTSLDLEFADGYPSSQDTRCLKLSTISYFLLEKSWASILLSRASINAAQSSVELFLHRH